MTKQKRARIRNGASVREWNCLRCLPRTTSVSQLPPCGYVAGCQLLIWSRCLGIQHLFDSLIGAIIEKKDMIERENEIKRRDSVMLSTSATPVWAAQADQEEAREKARAASGSSWSCCQT